MTENEQARIAVLENEVRHLREDIEKMNSRQSEMYALMKEATGGWKTLLAVAGVSGIAASILTKVAPFLVHLPK